MTLRRAELGLGLVALGTLLLLAATFLMTIIVLAWVVIAVGLAMLAREPAWRLAGTVGLAVHVVLTGVALAFAGVSVGILGRPLGGGGLGTDGDGVALWTTVGLLGAPLGALLALALAPEPSPARACARWMSVLPALGALAAIPVAQGGSSWWGVVGAPLVAAVVLAPIAAGWAYLSTRRGARGHASA